jgi:lipoate-protein ligase A
MSIDSKLFQQVVNGSMTTPILRFYGWAEETLSLGYHQPLDSLPDNPFLRELPWVRRPTGGRAVLHGDPSQELTYSLMVPATVIQAWEGIHSRQQVYDHLCQFLRRGLVHYGVELDHGADPHRNRDYRHRTSCFATSTGADLAWQGRKLMGNAQVWRQGSVLQQGSLLLQPDRQRWESLLPGSGKQVVGLNEIVGGIRSEDLVKTFSQAASEHLNCCWQDEPLSEQEFSDLAKTPTAEIWVKPLRG